MDKRLNNPFTPSFGGLPQHFYGRADILNRVKDALDNPNSPDRALFLTGPRGCGKTALLEQLSTLARSAGWYVIDVHSSHASDAISSRLAAHEAAVKAHVAPKIGLPGGVDVTLAQASATSAEAASSDLSARLEHFARTLVAGKGAFITIDEIQKIPERDMEEVCAAVQMSRRKGLPVALMLAGLPESKDLVASYPGCTFMQRVEDVRLSSLLVTETTDAFRDTLAKVPDIDASDEVVWSLASMSQGYPYLVQLVGYEFVGAMREAYPVGIRRATVDDVAAIDDAVYATYRKNVLVPSLKGIRADGKSFLRAMAGVLDGEGVARIADVAEAMEKTTKQLSTCRQMLIARRLILPVARGKICYGLPYLQRYSLEGDVPEVLDFTNRWIPR